MLPNTSVMGAPSMRMRVGSLIDTMASTETPSRASTNWSALTGLGAVAIPTAVAMASSRLAGAVEGCGRGLRSARIGNLLEGFEVHACPVETELDQVGLEVVGGFKAIDQGAQSATHHDALLVLAGHQLLRHEHRAGVDALEPFGLDLLPGDRKSTRLN